jgi:hypothetical protein
MLACAQHMRRIEPYADAILDSLVKIQYAHGHVPTIMYATAYSLENFTAHDFSCAHLLKPELPRSKELIDFLIKNARGETEAQNSPISKCGSTRALGFRCPDSCFSSGAAEAVFV